MSTNPSRDEQASAHPFTDRQTFAALRSVVNIPSFAIPTLEGSGRVLAFAFAVAAAVICRALVHV